MSFGLVDDKLHAHRKVARAGFLGMGLWVVAMTWSKDKKTDGFIPHERPVKLADGNTEIAAEAVKALVAAELWEPVEGGWRFHDWQEYQRSPGEESARKDEIRAARAEAGRKGGVAKASKALANAGKPQQDEANAGNAEQTLANPGPSPNPSPSPIATCFAGARADARVESPPETPQAETPPKPPRIADLNVPAPLVPLAELAQALADERVKFGQDMVDRLAAGGTLTGPQRTRLRQIAAEIWPPDGIPAREARAGAPAPAAPPKPKGPPRPPPGSEPGEWWIPFPAPPDPHMGLPPWAPDEPIETTRERGARRAWYRRHPAGPRMAKAVG